MNKYRNELKIPINPLDRVVISRRLSAVMPLDKNAGPDGTYKVRSLYFDDIHNTALQEKLTGLLYREKFRIRIYNDNADYIRLERKAKRGELGYKDTAVLTKAECLELLAGNPRFLLLRSEPVCRQLFVKMSTGLFSPKVIVEYDREAYVWPVGRVRITVDSNIRSTLAVNAFLEPLLSTTHVVEHGISVLEVKYDNYLPIHISNLIRLENRQVDAVSKYAMCRRFG